MNRQNMHEYIHRILEYPSFSAQTQEMALHLFRGIREDVWLWKHDIYCTPEDGLKIQTVGRGIESSSGYYEIYVHDYFVDIFINSAQGRMPGRVQISVERNENNWDDPFDWELINQALASVNGRKSSA